MKQSSHVPAVKIISLQYLKTVLKTSLYVNAFYLMLKVAVDAGAGFIFWIIAARFYAAEEVGLASATISMITLLGFFSMLGSNWGLMRFLPDSGENTRGLINTCFTITALAALVFSVIFLCGLGFWSPAMITLRQDLLLAVIFIVSTIAFTIISMVGIPFTARRRSGFSMTVTAISGLSRLVLLIPLALWFPKLGIFAAWSIGIIIAIIIAVPFMLPHIERGYRLVPTIKRDALNKIAHYASTNYATELVMVAPVNLLPLMVVNILGAEANAYFYIAWSMGGLFTFIGMGISTALFAEGSADEIALGKNIRASFKAFILFIPLLLIVFFLGDKILLLFGKDYSQSATQLLRIVAVCAVPITINYIFLAIKRVQKEMKSVIAVYAFIALLTIILTYLLLPAMDILGAGIAWLAAQGTVAIVTGWWIFKKFIRNPQGLKDGKR